MMRRSFSSKPLFDDTYFYEDTATLFVARVHDDDGLPTQYQISADVIGIVSFDAKIVTNTESNVESATPEKRYDVKTPLAKAAYTDNGGTHKLIPDSIASIPNAGFGSDSLNEGSGEDAPTDRVGKDSLAGCGLIIDGNFFYNFIATAEQEVDADGNVTGYTQVTTNTDASGNFYTSKNHYDVEWALTYSSYSDSAGNSSVTQYKASVDADGNVTGYTHITTSTDASGNSYTYTNNYDAQWTVTDSAYCDSAGNSSVTQYHTSIDSDGNVTGYTHTTISTDASGNFCTSENHYDAKWALTDSAYRDSAGNSSVTQYQTSIDADGNVIGYTHTTTNTDARGNFYTSENHYDANWALTDSTYFDNAGNSIFEGDSIANILGVGYAADSLNGSSGEDILTVRIENDALADAVGKDVFALNPVICNKIGVIVNLAAEVGEIQLSESVFAPLDAGVTLSNDMVFYVANSASGRGAENSGSVSGAVEIAQLSAPITHTSITLTDFSVI